MRAAAYAELCVSEAWYDAEEYLDPFKPTPATDRGHSSSIITKDVTNGRWAANVAAAQSHSKLNLN